MKKLVLLVIICIITFSSCRIDSVANLPQIDSIYKNCNNVKIIDGDNYSITYQILEGIEWSSILYYFDEKEAILLYGNDYSDLLWLDLAELIPHTISENMYDNQKVTYLTSDKEWVIYFIARLNIDEYKELRYDQYALMAYNIDNNTNYIIQIFDNSPVVNNFVIIDSYLYFDFLENQLEDGNRDFNIERVNLLKLNRETICEHASMPMKYKSELIFIKNNKELVAYREGELFKLYNLEELHLFKQIYAIGASCDILSYTYYTMAKSQVLGGGVGFINNNERFDLIESDIAAYPSLLLANKKYMIFNDTSYEHHLMFYDRNINNFIILEYSSCFNLAFLGEDSVLFCAEYEGGTHLIKVT